MFPTAAFWLNRCTRRNPRPTSLSFAWHSHLAYCLHFKQRITPHSLHFAGISGILNLNYVNWHSLIRHHNLLSNVSKGKTDDVDVLFVTTKIPAFSVFRLLWSSRRRSWSIHPSRDDVLFSLVLCAEKTAMSFFQTRIVIHNWEIGEWNMAGVGGSARVRASYCPQIGRWQLWVCRLSLKYVVVSYLII